MVLDRPGAIDPVERLGDVRWFEDVHFDYLSGTPVLHGVDSTRAPATRWRSSAGRAPASRRSRACCRFYDVTGGLVLVDGDDVRDLTQMSLRHHVGLVLDEPFPFSESVRDNIAYGRPDADFEDVVAAAKAAHAHEFILELEDGYDTVVGERGYTLSGGQRQCIVIAARTLLVNLLILVLDDYLRTTSSSAEQGIHDAHADARRPCRSSPTA